MSAVLELEQVTKNYPGSPPVRALDRVSLAVAAGELVAVVGPSGSGKSTLLHLMGTLDQPTAGTVRVTGLDAAAMSDRELAGLRAVPDRVRVPAVLPRRAPESTRQRRRRAAVRRRPPGPAPPARRRRAGPGRAGTPRQRPPDPAVRRGTAAGGDRPGDRRPPADGAGRRAHRQPGLRHRRSPSWPCSKSSTRPAPRSSWSPTTSAIAARMRRRIEMLDGHIVNDTSPAHAGGSPGPGPRRKEPS